MLTAGCEVFRTSQMGHWVWWNPISRFMEESLMREQTCRDMTGGSWSLVGAVRDPEEQKTVACSGNGTSKLHSILVDTEELSA